MKAGKIDGFTRELGKPLDWDDSKGECGVLAIKDSTEHGYSTMESAWYPDALELQRLLAGAPVVLCVVGGSHPPVSVNVGEVPRDVATGG